MEQYLINKITDKIDELKREFKEIEQITFNEIGTSMIRFCAIINGEVCSYTWNMHDNFEWCMSTFRNMIMVYCLHQNAEK